MIHDLDDIRRADPADLILLVVQVGDFLVDAAASLADERHIHHAVLVATHVAETYHDSFNLLVAEDPSRTPARSLLETSFLAPHVIPGGVEHPNADVVCGLPGGVINSGEYVADTNPTNALSYFHIQSIADTPLTTVIFASSTNRQYTLYYCTNLAGGIWTSVPDQQNIHATGETTALTETNTLPGKYYRVGVSVP